MTEADQIAHTPSPVTKANLITDLKTLGLKPGDLVLVHSSLSALGWVSGGPVAVIEALIETIGSNGTIAMPAHSSQVTDPEFWGAPPVPEGWPEIIRDTMPAFDPRTTPTRQMGQIAELFRTWPGAMRSAHPATSFSALGPLAEQITAQHPLDDPLGAGSPLGRLYELQAKILLMGVDFDRCTALHLAELRAWPERARRRDGAPLMIDGARQWVSFEIEPVMDSDAFIPIGARALHTGIAHAGPLGQGRGMIMDMRALVDFSISEMPNPGPDTNEPGR